MQTAFSLDGKSWVEVQQMNPCTDDTGNMLKGSFNCQLFELQENTTVVPSKNILYKVALMHDCKTGHCTFASEDVEFTAEREKVTKHELTFVHSESRFYLLNRFSLNMKL